MANSLETTDGIERAMTSIWESCAKDSGATWMMVNGEFIRLAQEPTPAEAVCNPQWLRRLMSSGA